MYKPCSCLKCLLITVLLLVCFSPIVHAQSGVSIGKGGDAPSINAIFELVSNSKGILIPRMSTSDRTSISPQNTEYGLLLYDTDTQSFWSWNGDAWIEIGGGTSEDNQNLFLRNDSLMIDDGNGIPFELLGDYLYVHISDSLLSDSTFVSLLGDSLLINESFITQMSDYILQNQQFLDSLINIVYEGIPDSLLANHDWLMSVKDSVDTHLDSISVRNNMTYFYVSGIAVDSIGNNSLSCTYGYVYEGSLDDPHIPPSDLSSFIKIYDNGNGALRTDYFITTDGLLSPTGGREYAAWAFPSDWGVPKVFVSANSVNSADFEYANDCWHYHHSVEHDNIMYTVIVVDIAYLFDGLQTLYFSFK